MARLRNRELDMFSAAAETPERQDYALFTQPYLTLPAVVFARDNASFVDGFAGLAGGRVAAVEGYAVTEHLRGKAADFELVEVADVEAGLRALSAGEVDFRSEEHTSELQSLMRTSYAVFCLKTKKIRTEH